MEGNTNLKRSFSRAGSRLSLKEVSIDFDGKPVLEGISFEVAPGELLALTGPSGSGKTTLLRAVAGLIDVRCGEILFDGKPRESFGWPQYRRCAVLFDQQPRLFDADVMANLEVPFRYRSARRCGFPEQRARKMLERLGIGECLNARSALRLSVGQQQRVNLVRGLLLEPRLVLLDEPTGALDENAVADVEALVRDEADRRGMSAVIVIHDREQARRWCDRIYDIGAHSAATHRATPGADHKRRS